jgi:hypothetical protein
MPTRVSLGRVVSTPGALATFSTEEYSGCLQRHARGDWGDLVMIQRLRPSANL